MTRRRWGGPTWTSHVDKLKYDATYAEWWRVTDGLWPKGYRPKMARSSIDHNDRDITQIGVVWVNTSRNGKVYMNGFLEDGRKIVLFESNFRGQGNSPDYTLHVATYTDDERATLKQEQEARQAQRQAQAQQQNTSQAPGAQPVQQQPIQQQPVQPQVQPAQQVQPQPVQQSPAPQPQVQDNLPI